ncbi:MULTISPECIES: DUF4221 family protein [unclassified Bacteroides]|uniref:DUF4221 family protein n=1 Tax=unclassified Bacteroides TaxID=2646097 RepID=UPI0013EA20D3|nr:MULTISPECIES: DUF4221 family protein [unclassified Bacteroides]QTO27157.1 DUF4221 family protein [Bacteroides sp. ZJ-18]
MLRKAYYLGLFLLIVSCSENTINIKNDQEGKLQATYHLVEKSDKVFRLDSETAPKPPYMQIFEDSLKKRILTLLNPYKNAIYFYNYEDSGFIKKIIYPREGANAVLRLSGYYIKNTDSIYIYNMPMTEVILSNSLGYVNKRISLRGNVSDWPNYYPQYLLATINPFIHIGDELLLTGQSFTSIPSANLHRFKFAAYINMHNNKVEFHHIYPEEIYGSNSNWEGGLPTQVYPALTPHGELVFSFPASHNLYITKCNSETYTKIYGGSNIATTIHSIDFSDPAETPNQLITENYLREDMYGGILYDSYRKIYYRFLLQGIPNATISSAKEEKPISIIMMDDKFNYLGETTIGTGKKWNWENSFVTREGLNVEYLDSKDINEDYLIFKIFVPEAIKNI